MGRFISEDTIGFGGGDANLYRYVGNSPTNFIDPDGEDPLSTAVGVAIAISIADGPLPVGDIVGLGIIGAAGIWQLIDPPAPEFPKPLIFPEESIDLDDFTPGPDEPYNPEPIPPFPNPGNQQDDVCSVPEPLPGFGQGLEPPNPEDFILQVQYPVGPGVGGNGTASEFGDLTGLTRQEADDYLIQLGATKKGGDTGKYTTYKFPDKSKVTIENANGRVVRNPAPKYGHDGRNLNRGLRLNKDGSLLKTRDESGAQIDGTHDTGEYVN